MSPPVAAALAEALEKTAWSLFQLTNCIEDEQVRKELAKETIGPAFQSLRDAASILFKAYSGSPPHEKPTIEDDQKP